MEPDYKVMYFEMFRAAEKSINILVEAQRKCEELYISADETLTKIIPLKKD